MYQNVFNHQFPSQSFPSNFNMSYGNPIYLNRPLNNPLYNIPFSNTNIISNNYPLYTYENQYTNFPQMHTPNSMNAFNYSFPLKAQSIRPQNQTNLIREGANLSMNLNHPNQKYQINSEANVGNKKLISESYKEIKKDIKNSNYPIRHSSEIGAKSQNNLHEEIIQSKLKEKPNIEVKKSLNDKAISGSINQINANSILNSKIEINPQLLSATKKPIINFPQLDPTKENKNLDLQSLEFAPPQESGYFKIPSDVDQINDKTELKKESKNLNNQKKSNNKLDRVDHESDFFKDSKVSRTEQKQSEQLHSSNMAKLDENTFKKFDSLSNVLVSYALFEGNVAPK